MTLLERIKVALLGDYEFYRILVLTAAPEFTPLVYECCELLNLAELEASAFEELRSMKGYAAPESRCFVARESGIIVGVCWYWFGETYRQRRHFWPIGERAAKLVQITTAAAHRGRGIAEDLLRYSSRAMLESGFERLFARVWHSHRASLRAFARTGWTEIAIVFSATPLGRQIRFEWPRRRAGGDGSGGR